MLNLKPLPGYVILELDKPQDFTLSGRVVLPDTARKRDRNNGTIVAVADHRHPQDGQVGDYVTFDPQAGTEITWNDTEYIILNDDDLWIILFPEENGREWPELENKISTT